MGHLPRAGQRLPHRDPGAHRRPLGVCAELLRRVDWSGLALTVEEIERIEVVRGNQPNAFGANAFLGVINIITRHPSRTGRPRPGQWGNHGIADLQAAWTAAKATATGLRLSAVQTRDNGFNLRDRFTLARSSACAATSRLDARNELTLRAGYNKGRERAGHPLTPSSTTTPNAAGSTKLQPAPHLALHRERRREWLASLYHNRESGVDRWLANGMDANGRQCP